jgi:hypothetical protein
MVRVFLRGGLGNQMFQYAAGLAVAQKYNLQLSLDTTYLSDRTPRKDFTYRNFDLDIFALNPGFTGLSRIAHAMPIPGLWLGIDVIGIGIKDVIGIQKLVKEKREYIFDPEIIKEPRTSVIFWGRWQSEKYFSEKASDVRSAFQFRFPLEGKAKELAREIQNSNSVSIHVRRGDYATFKNIEEKWGKTDLSYYSRAIEYMARKINSPHFFIFSDDSEWCKQNLKIVFPATYLDETSAGPKAAFHLELMSLASHNIIANSSFSWWGSWLNANPEKIVIAPKQWERGISTENSDIIPNGWITL